jgi:DNA-binding SARP family transcriptional activator/tetratricopeptide (TPR) repeat protein
LLQNDQLQILLLGPPEIRWSGAPYSIQRQTPRTVLYYLASRGSLISRAELLPLFWPEESEPVARLRLRETLNKLKKGLPRGDLLISRGDKINLNYEKIYVDLLDFHERISKIGQLPWKIPPEDPLPEPVYQQLKEAFQLWRGSTVLAGAKITNSLFLDKWFSNIASYNENIFLRILERLSDHEAAIGNLENALNLVRQAALYHEFDEELHVRVLHLLIRLGSIKEARKYFKEVQTRLLQEMNLQPSVELRELYEQIRSDTRPLQSNHLIFWNIHSSLQVPFIGRQKQLFHLHHAYQQGGGLFLLGESGIGKTRLLQEFYSQLQPLPRLILARCRPTESNLPFQPLIDVLRQCALPKEWLGLPRSWANHLKVLFPELNSLRSDLSPLPDVEPEQARSLLFEALRQLFLILGKSQHLLLILDDGQWADEASLEAILYMQGRSPFEKQSLVIFASRLVDTNIRLKKHLALAQSHFESSLLQLPQMELNEIDALSHQVLGTSPSPHFVSRLAHETGGNPFFILETLHALIKQQPDLNLNNLNSFPVAESITSLINNRFQLLSPIARTTIEVAAVIGPEFSTRILTQASDLTADEVALALDELVEQNLITRLDVSSQLLKYRFLHDQFREVALLNINPLRAQIIHRKIAFALMQDEKERVFQSAILAYHFESAAELCLAFEYWVIAGQRAYQLYAISDASQAFQKAENLIEDCWGVLSELQIYNLYKNWGEMAYAANDASALKKMNTNLMGFGNRLESALLKGTAFVQLGNAYFSSGQLKEGLEYTRKAIDLLSTTDNIYQLTNARTNLGVFCYMTGHVTEAIEILESALEVVIDTDDRDLLFLRANLLYEIGMSMFLNGQPLKSLDYGLKCLQDYREINSLVGTASAYSVLSLASYYSGNYSQGFHYSHQGIENANQTQSWRMLGYLYDYRAMLEYATGNLDAMSEFVNQAIELGKSLGQPDIYATGYRLMSDLFYLMGNYEKSLEYLKSAQVKNHISFISLDSLYRLKSLLFLLEQKEELITDLREIINQAETSGFITGKLLAQISLMMAYQAVQRWEDANTLASEIKVESFSRGFRAFGIAANLVLAQYEWLAGHHPAAFDLVNESILEAESLPIIWLEIRGRVLLAQFSQQTGHSTEANRQRINKIFQMLQRSCQGNVFKSTLQAYSKHIEGILS